MRARSTLSKGDLLTLVESAKSLSSEIDLADLLTEILERASQLTDSPSGSILLYDGERKGLYFAAATGPKAQRALEQFGELSPGRVPIRKADSQEYASVAGKVYDTGQYQINDAVQPDSEHFKGVDEEV